MIKEVTFGYGEDGEFEITARLLTDDRSHISRSSVYVSQELAQRIASQMRLGAKGKMITRQDESVTAGGPTVR